MNKIKAVSFYIARLLYFMTIALPVYIIFKWIFLETPFLECYLSLPFDWLTSDTIINTISSNQITIWSPSTKILACVAQLIGIMPFLGILYFLSNIFHRYELGEIFTTQNAQSYYKIGKLLFFNALLAQPISGSLSVAAVTLSNPVGPAYINISIGIPNIMAVFMGLLVVFISWVMIEGSKIQNEQQLII